MYLNGFSARIPEGRESGGYVELGHGEHYTLRLRNNNHPRCDAKVEIDNQHVGTFRLNGGQSIRLERPAHDEGKFTFYLAGSEEAEKIGLDEDDPHLGLIKVTFMPEKKRVTNTDNTIWYDSGLGGNLRMASVTYSAQAGGQSAQAGGTGLSGKSDQEFSSTAPLDYDRSRITTIHLRLVGRDDDEPRPLTSFSTPIPPPVR